jgi:hypothetical protein
MFRRSRGTLWGCARRAPSLLDEGMRYLPTASFLTRSRSLESELLLDLRLRLAESIRADLLACVMLGDEAPQPEVVVNKALNLGARRGAFSAEMFPVQVFVRR